MKKYLFFKIRKYDDTFKDEQSLKDLLNRMNDSIVVARQVDLILDILDIEKIKITINEFFRAVPGYVEYQNTFYLYNSKTKKSDILEIMPNKIILTSRNKENLFYDFLKLEFPEIISLQLENVEYEFS